jgi:hypothetical protein
VLFIDDQERNVDGAMEVGMQGAVFNIGAGAERLVSLLRRFKLLVGPEDAGVSF